MADNNNKIRLFGFPENEELPGEDSSDMSWENLQKKYGIPEETLNIFRETLGEDGPDIIAEQIESQLKNNPSLDQIKINLPFPKKEKDNSLFESDNLEELIKSLDTIIPGFTEYLGQSVLNGTSLSDIIKSGLSDDSDSPNDDGQKNSIDAFTNDSINPSDDENFFEKNRLMRKEYLYKNINNMFSKKARDIDSFEALSAIATLNGNKILASSLPSDVFEENLPLISKIGEFELKLKTNNYAIYLAQPLDNEKYYPVAAYSYVGMDGKVKIGFPEFGNSFTENGDLNEKTPKTETPSKAKNMLAPLMQLMGVESPDSTIDDLVEDERQEYTPDPAKLKSEVAFLFEKGDSSQYMTIPKFGKFKKSIEGGILSTDIFKIGNVIKHEEDPDNDITEFLILNNLDRSKTNFEVFVKLDKETTFIEQNRILGEILSQINMDDEFLSKFNLWTDSQSHLIIKIKSLDSLLGEIPNWRDIE